MVCQQILAGDELGIWERNRYHVQWRPYELMNWSYVFVVPRYGISKPYKSVYRQKLLANIW